jgi:hypothetical protein
LHHHHHHHHNHDGKVVHLVPPSSSSSDEDQPPPESSRFSRRVDATIFEPYETMMVAGTQEIEEDHHDDQQSDHHQQHSLRFSRRVEATIYEFLVPSPHLVTNSGGGVSGSSSYSGASGDYSNNMIHPHELRVDTRQDTRQGRQHDAIVGQGRGGNGAMIDCVEPSGPPPVIDHITYCQM